MSAPPPFPLPLPENPPALPTGPSAAIPAAALTSNLSIKAWYDLEKAKAKEKKRHQKKEAKLQYQRALAEAKESKKQAKLQISPASPPCSSIKNC